MPRIALVQQEIVPGAVRENMAKIEAGAAIAAQGRASLVVFPEYALTGPLLGQPRLVDRDGRFRLFFQALAARLGLSIVSGSFVEATSSGWQNVTYLIDQCGDILGRYAKVNLWWSERKHLSPGTEICVAASALGRIGLAICWDLAFPEVFRTIALRTADMVVCPSYWTEGPFPGGRFHGARSERYAVNALCASRAVENGLSVVYCNAAGANRLSVGDVTLIGQSQVCMPLIGSLYHARHNRETTAVVDVDFDVLQEAEAAYGLRSDLARRAA